MPFQPSGQVQVYLCPLFKGLQVAPFLQGCVPVQSVVCTKMKANSNESEIKDKQIKHGAI